MSKDGKSRRNEPKWLTRQLTEKEKKDSSTLTFESGADFLSYREKLLEEK